ncbi:hypothetical protein AM588_10002543 [Phytophthora nicotianae]|uniref:Uncharacterized protein n=1 Tax=Phytophthora nicotianae TaxID=4792 RepID=A0A0W8D0U4_PHYNI|nr:hypothetical protein AM588_10002543 [Phytophthora nicotianae]
MSGWVSAWLQGKSEGDEESKEEGFQTGGNTLSDGSAPATADEIRRKRLQKLQEQQQAAQETVSANQNTASPKDDVIMSNPDASSPQVDKKQRVEAVTPAQHP